jgi:hypothetical protein
MLLKMRVPIADDANLIRDRLQEMVSVSRKENEKIVESHPPDFL